MLSTQFRPSDKTHHRAPIGALLLAVIYASSTTAIAHDMWIEPTNFSPKEGDVIGARLRVGRDFVGDPMPRNDSLINQFIVEDAGGRRSLAGRDGSDPAGLLRVSSPGLLVIGYRSYPSLVEQTAEKFTQYLKEEGLEAVAELRAKRGQTGGVRELYSRAAKCLVLAGTPGTNASDRALGFTLELVAERSPYRMTADQELPVRLTFEGRPLAGALVVAMNELLPSDKLSARTNRDGRARFRLAQTGRWLIKAVHMTPARSEAHADWESIWASLTFELPGAGAAVTAIR